MKIIKSKSGDLFVEGWGSEPGIYPRLDTNVALEMTPSEFFVVHSGQGDIYEFPKSGAPESVFENWSSFPELRDVQSVFVDAEARPRPVRKTSPEGVEPPSFAPILVTAKWIEENY